MQKSFKTHFRITQKNSNSMRNNVFGADTQFDIKGIYSDYSRSSDHYKYRSLNNYRKFFASRKPIITLNPTNTMGPGYGGQDNNKFIQLGLMPQYINDTLNIIPYVALTKAKQDNYDITNRYDTDPQVRVFPLAKYDIRGDLTFSLSPYIPYQAQMNINIQPQSNMILLQIVISNMYKSPLDPQYVRWHLGLSGDTGYTTGDAVINNILNVPFYTYPIGMLQQFSASRVYNAMTANYNRTQLAALTRLYDRVDDTNQILLMGRWTSSDQDSSFIRSMYGSTASSRYGIRYVSQGTSKFSQRSNIDNLDFSTDFYEQDTNNNFKNLRNLGSWGPRGYNYLTQRQDIIAKKQDGKIIRDTAQVKTDRVDKGLYIASDGNKTLPDTITVRNKFVSSWWQKIYAGMGNYYHPRSYSGLSGGRAGYINGAILFHSPWAMWDVNNYSLLLAPVVVGPLRCSSTLYPYLYNLMGTHTITGTNLSPRQISSTARKASWTKFGIAYKGSTGTQFVFNTTLTGLTGTNMVDISYNDSNFYTINRNSHTATLSVNGYPFVSFTGLPSSYSSTFNAYVTFNNNFYVIPSGTGFYYPGSYMPSASLTRNVSLNNLHAHAWKQQLQFPVQMMDFNVWSRINFEFAKLANVGLTKKTGNLSLDFISAKSVREDQDSVIEFDYSDTDSILDMTYALSAYRYAPPTSLSYSSVSRIKQYNIQIPFTVKGNKITDVTYQKSNRLGSVGSQYYTLTINRYIDSGSLLYVGQTGTDHLYRMDSVTQVKNFADSYLNRVPGYSTFKQQWRAGYTATSLSSGYRIGMTQDLCYSHSARTGLEYYTNIYSTLFQNFLGTSGTYGQNWTDSRYSFNSSSSRRKYIQFKVDVPVNFFRQGNTSLTPIISQFNPYDIYLFPSTGFVNSNQYPSSTSISAYGYYGSGAYRGYDKNVIYSYAAAYSGSTGSLNVPATGGMWKALQIGQIISTDNLSILSGLKMRFSQA